ncbi:hypothetical protein C8Q75DRAFT_610481 [Abortiporus biennis]|nr:hypothetical protein C8Q75DRAFT_610481 [Abortiporus biennis]
MDVDDHSSPCPLTSVSTSAAPSSSRSISQRSVIVETISETFLISPQEEEPLSDENKENITSINKYMISLVPRKSSSVAEKENEEKIASTSKTTSGSDRETMQVDKPAAQTESAFSHSKVNGEPSTVEPPKDISTQDEAKSPSSDLVGKDAKSNESSLPAKPIVNGVVSSPPVESKPSSDQPNKQVEPTALNGIKEKPTVNGVLKVVETKEASKSQTADDVSKSATSDLPSSKKKDVEVLPRPSTSKGVDASAKETPTLQVLQRDLLEDNLDFADDGVSVLSSEVENGMRRGWKIEVKCWRFADPVAV